MSSPEPCLIQQNLACLWPLVPQILIWVGMGVMGLYELVKYMSGPKNGGMDVVGELGKEEPK